MAVAAVEKGCWWLLRLLGEGGCWLLLAKRVVAGSREVPRVAGYNCQGEQLGASVKESFSGRCSGEVAGRYGRDEEATQFWSVPSFLPAAFAIRATLLVSLAMQ